MSSFKVDQLAAQAPLHSVADIGWRIAAEQDIPLGLVDRLVDAQRLAELIHLSQRNRPLERRVSPLLQRPFTLFPRLSSTLLPLNRRASPILFDSEETAMAQAANSRKRFLAAITTPLPMPLRASHNLIACNWQSDQTVRLHSRHFQPLYKHDERLSHPNRWRLIELLKHRGAEAAQFALADNQGLASQLLQPACFGAPQPMAQQRVFSETDPHVSCWLCNSQSYRFR